MAVIKCKECNNPISTKSKTCPYCDAKVKLPMTTGTWIAIGIFVFLVTIGLIAGNTPVVSVEPKSPDDLRTEKINEVLGADDKEEHKISDLGVIYLNLCESDPENADHWGTTRVNLFSKPGGLSIPGNTLSFKIPACENKKLEILEKRVVGGIERYRVRYGANAGWQTKRLLTGDE